MKASALSIVIPNWNGRDLLETHIPSVWAALQGYEGQGELVVVDDGSSDDSVAFMKEHFPEVQLVVHPENRGFGPACLSGAQTARNPILILLNSDVSVEEDFIAPLVRPFQHDTVFSTSPLIFEKTGQPRDVTISIPYLKRGKIRYRKFPTELLVEKGADAPHPWYTLFPSGGAFAVRRKNFLDLGGFDPLYHPFYYEDTDLGFRAWRRGWTCQVVPESHVTHHDRGTIARSFKRARVLTARRRNRLLYLCKNLTSNSALAKLLIFHCFRVLYRTLTLDWIAPLSTLSALPRIPMALRKRRLERDSMERSEAEIFDIIASNARLNCEALDSNAQNTR